jgi:hypothetical protein
MKTAERRKPGSALDWSAAAVLHWDNLSIPREGCAQQERELLPISTACGASVTQATLIYQFTKNLRAGRAFQTTFVLSANCAEGRTQLSQKLLGRHRFCQHLESAIPRLVEVLRVSRGEQDGTLGEPLLESERELNAIHRPPHLDVAEHNVGHGSRRTQICEGSIRTPFLVTSRPSARSISSVVAPTSWLSSTNNMAP